MKIYGCVVNADYAIIKDHCWIRKDRVRFFGLDCLLKNTSEEETPLSEQTNTGKLIQKIEEMCNEVSTYKTNLVKCLPLTEQQKLRYPSKKEMDKCFDNLVSEINAMSPKIVFLLGEKVYSSVARHLHLDFEKWNDFEYHYTECNGTYYVPIHHPSYICVYKRKQMDDYIAAVEK